MSIRLCTRSLLGRDTGALNLLLCPLVQPKEDSAYIQFSKIPVKGAPIVLSFKENLTGNINLCQEGPHQPPKLTYCGFMPLCGSPIRARGPTGQPGSSEPGLRVWHKDYLGHMGIFQEPATLDSEMLGEI